MPGKPRSIDDYLAGVGPERRAALQALRRTIRSLLPRAEECISYAMPAFRLDGAVVAGFLATGKGCSYFPFSGTTLDGMAAALGDRSRTKSALHFTPERPLPRALVKRLLEARIAECRPAEGAGKPARASAPARRKVGGARAPGRSRTR